MLDQRDSIKRADCTSFSSLSRLNAVAGMSPIFIRSTRQHEAVTVKATSASNRPWLARVRAMRSFWTRGGSDSRRAETRKNFPRFRNGIQHALALYRSFPSLRPARVYNT